MGSNWDFAREVRTALNVRNKFKSSRRDDQLEYDPTTVPGAKGIQKDRQDKPPAAASRPGASHYNSAPVTYQHGAQAFPGPPGNQWPPQDSSSSHQGTLQSSGQSMYPPPQNTYQAPGQQPQYRQQQGNNPQHYQNTSQNGQSSPPRPGPDPRYPVNHYTGYPSTNVNPSAQNVDPHSNYYDSNSNGQGQTYPPDQRTYGAATAPPASQHPYGVPLSAANYGGTNYNGRQDHQQGYQGGYDDNPWRNEPSYNYGPNYNGGPNVQGHYR